MFFDYQLVGPTAVEGFLRGWVDRFGCDTSPANAPTFDDGPADTLMVQRFRLQLDEGVSVAVVMTASVAADEVAHPTFYAFNATVAGRSVWRYCRNRHHPEDGTVDHLHIDGHRIPLHEPPTLEQITARILATRRRP